MPGLPDNDDGVLNEDEFLKFVAEYKWADPEDAAETTEDEAIEAEMVE